MFAGKLTLTLSKIITQQKLSALLAMADHAKTFSPSEVLLTQLVRFRTSNTLREHNDFNYVYMTES